MGEDIYESQSCLWKYANRVHLNVTTRYATDSPGLNFKFRKFILMLNFEFEIAIGVR